jgi:hypothetical protein
MITVKRKIQFAREAHGRRRVATETTEWPPKDAGRIPRISRLMAVAIRLERLLLTGEVSDVMELARLGHVTQPRMSQILNLTLLAPDIQEELLFLPRVTAGKATIHEKLLRPIVVVTDWDKQREMWEALKSSLSNSSETEAGLEPLQ